MKTRINRLLISILSCLIFLISCADTEKEEIKFKVISYGGDFNGSYSLDSATNVFFDGVGSDNTGYIYEKEVDVEDQLEIDASPVDTTGDSAPTSLEIKIYRDGSLIKSVQDSSDPVEAISLIYTSGEAASSN